MPIIVAAVLFAAGVISKHDLATPGAALGLQVFAYALALIVFAFLPRLAQRSWSDLGLRVPHAREIAWGFLGALVMLIVVDGVAGLEEHLFHGKITEQAIDLLKATKGTLLTTLFVIFACVVAPFFEELQFRGFLYNALRRYVPAGWAAAISSLLFGAAHLSPLAVVPLACGGFVLAVLYERTRSLVATTIAHGLFNTAGIIALLVFHQQ